MACKTKKLKLRKYSKGSTLPKYGGTETDNNQLPYMQQTTDIFAPQQQYGSLSAYNKYQNEQQYGTGLSTSTTTQQQSNNIKSSTGDLINNITGSGGTTSTYASIAQLAGSLTEGMGTEDYEAQFGEHQSTVADIGGMAGPYGALFSGIGETGGNILKGQVDYDEYGNPGDVDWHNTYYVAGSFFDPAGSAEYWLNEGDTGKAVQSFLLPGLGGMNIAENERDLAKQRELEAKRVANQARLQEINKDVVNYRPVFKYGGKLKKYQDGGIMGDPTKLESLTPQPIRQEPTGYMYKQGKLEPYYQGQDIKVPGYQRPLMGDIDNPYNPGKNVKLYSSKITPVTHTSTMTAASGEPRQLARESAIYRTADILGIPAETIKLNPEMYFQEVVRQNNRFQQSPTSLGESSLKEIIPTSRYETTGGKVKFNYGGNLDYMNPGNINRPTVFKYGGQTHNGPDEGIEVDATGIPTIMSGKAPVALTEKNEVAFKGPDMESAYIFSDKIRYKKL